MYMLVRIVRDQLLTEDMKRRIKDCSERCDDLSKKFPVRLLANVNENVEHVKGDVAKLVTFSKQCCFIA